ncbi:MAG TPA: signal recognition particle-docking protein FtsY [Stellaceae bacterium]|nr:signal recognition particle-docking protein FtsY [Stellaceae bacterium]
MRFWRRNVPAGSAPETEAPTLPTVEETARHQSEPEVEDAAGAGPRAEPAEPRPAPEPAEQHEWVRRHDLPAPPAPEAAEPPRSLPEEVSTLRRQEPEIGDAAPSPSPTPAPAAFAPPTERHGGLWRRILAQPDPEVVAPAISQPEETTALGQPEAEAEAEIAETVAPPVALAPTPSASPAERTDHGLWPWRRNKPAETPAEIEEPPPSQQEPAQQEPVVLRQPQPEIGSPEVGKASTSPPELAPPTDETDHRLLWRRDGTVELAPEIEGLGIEAPAVASPSSPAPPAPTPPGPDQKDSAALRQVEPEPDIATATRPPEPAAPIAAAAETAEQRRGWFTRLRAGLSRSSARLNEGINAIFNRRRLDDEALEELEELLIASDMGVGIAGEVTESLRRTRFNQEVSPEEVRTALADQVIRLIEPVTRPLRIDRSRKPFVILVIGVNGSGKTTTIAKLAKQYRDEGMQVVLAAGDTFRAAAVEQLQIWGERTGCAVVTRPAGADAAGLAYDALVHAQGEGADILLIDTAGRLHNKADLMGELQKILRVLKKVDAAAPHSVLLVLDATTGQNAHAQAETFREMVGVTGIVMTKLDGTARGGVLVSLAEKYGIPIHAIGVGETADDLRPFEARAYARSLVGLEP